MSEPSNQLKLLAMDSEDLGIISAHCQDAVLRLADIAYLKSQRRFALLINRFDWETALEDQPQKNYQRRRTALRFECVNAVQHLNINLTKKDTIHKLLAINFEQGAAPSGDVSLIFSGGGEIKLAVEYIEAELQDLGAAWQTKSLPDHKLGE